MKILFKFICMVFSFFVALLGFAAVFDRIFKLNYLKINSSDENFFDKDE